MKRIIASIMLLLSAIGFSQSSNTSDPFYTVKTKSVKKLAKKFLKKHRIPGMAISVSHHGELIWSKGFGFSNKKSRTKVKPDKTIFRIASISKSITAVALAKMVDDGLINLDESIHTYLPDYPKRKYDFSIRQLAGNIAGIRHYKDTNEYALNKKLSITEGLSIFKNDSLLFKPSTQYSYSTFGFVLLSEVMQKVAKKPFDSLINESIFSPLSMQQSLMEISDVTVLNKTQFYKTNSLQKVVPSKLVSNEYKVAGGGFLSTSEDVVKFGNELIFPRILSQNAISEITTSQRLVSGAKTGYGIGFSIEKTKNGTPKIYHTGGGVGASTILLIYPEEELVISVLTNLTGVSMADFGRELEAFFIN